MACRISELVLGCRDPEVLARFWCEVLDFVVLDREEDGSLEIGPHDGFGGPQPTIILSHRDEPEQGKPRLHIDVNATDRNQDAEPERLLKTGGSPGRHRPDRRGALARSGRPRGQRVLPAQGPPQPALKAPFAEVNPACEWRSRLQQVADAVATCRFVS